MCFQREIRDWDVNAWETFGTLEGKKLDCHKGYIFLTFSLFIFQIKYNLDERKTTFPAIFLPFYCLNFCFLFSFIFLWVKIYLMMVMGANYFASNWKLNWINVTRRFIWFLQKIGLVYKSQTKSSLLWFHWETWLT